MTDPLKDKAGNSVVIVDGPWYHDHKKKFKVLLGKSKFIWVGSMGNYTWTDKKGSSARAIFEREGDFKSGHTVYCIFIFEGTNKSIRSFIKYLQAGSYKGRISDTHATKLGLDARDSLERLKDFDSFWKGKIQAHINSNAPEGFIRAAANKYAVERLQLRLELGILNEMGVFIIEDEESQYMFSGMISSLKDVQRAIDICKNNTLKVAIKMIPKRTVFTMPIDVGQGTEWHEIIITFSEGQYFKGENNFKVGEVDV